MILYEFDNEHFYLFLLELFPLATLLCYHSTDLCITDFNFIYVNIQIKNQLDPFDTADFLSVFVGVLVLGNTTNFSKQCVFNQISAISCGNSHC